MKSLDEDAKVLNPIPKRKRWVPTGLNPVLIVGFSDLLDGTLPDGLKKDDYLNGSQEAFLRRAAVEHDAPVFQEGVGSVRAAIGAFGENLTDFDADDVLKRLSSGECGEKLAGGGSRGVGRSYWYAEVYEDALFLRTGVALKRTNFVFAAGERTMERFLSGRKPVPAV